MTAQRTLAWFRLWAFVLLATIGLQAMSPVAAPLQRELGSAFSAATADVALASTRRAESTRLVLPTPPLPRDEAVIRLVPMAAALLPIAHLRPAATGPPPRLSPQRLPDLRGPPLA
jgi:hypothetical protein